MNRRVLAAVSLCVLLYPAIGSAQGQPSDAAANWSAIARCAAAADAASRHQCMDGVLRQAGVLSEGQVVRETRAEFGVQRRDAERRAEAVASVPARAAAVVVPPAAPPLDELTTTIAAVASSGYQRIRVTTAEGSVWDQTQARTFTSSPQVGDAFIIERGAVGGYRCRFARASLYRCERAN